MTRPPRRSNAQGARIALSSKVKMKVDNETYRMLRTEFQDQNDEAILEMLVRSFHENSGLERELSLLRERNEDLAGRLEEAEGSNRHLEKELRSVEKERDNLRKRYRSVCAKVDNGPEEPVVVEKVVCHEDRRALDELRDKCEKLKERLWEHQAHEEEMRSQLTRLEVLEARDSRWRREYHGLILRAKDGRTLPSLELRLIDSKAYFQHKLDPENFKERHHLNGPFLVKELPYGE